MIIEDKKFASFYGKWTVQRILICGFKSVEALSLKSNENHTEITVHKKVTWIAKGKDCTFMDE